jgi:hypothetical protein
MLWGLKPIENHSPEAMLIANNTPLAVPRDNGLMRKPSSTRSES